MSGHTPYRPDARPAPPCNDNVLRLLLNSIRSKSAPDSAPPRLSTPLPLYPGQPRPQLLVPNLASVQDRQVSQPVSNASQGAVGPPVFITHHHPPNVAPDFLRSPTPPQHQHQQQQNAVRQTFNIPPRVHAAQHNHPALQVGAPNLQELPFNQGLPPRSTGPEGLNLTQSTPQTLHQRHLLGQPQILPSSPGHDLPPTQRSPLPRKSIQLESTNVSYPTVASFLQPPIRPSQLVLPPSLLVSRDPLPVNAIDQPTPGSRTGRAPIPPNFHSTSSPTKPALPTDHTPSQRSSATLQQHTPPHSPDISRTSIGPVGTAQGTVSQLAMPPGLQTGPSHNSNPQDESLLVVFNGLKGILNNLHPQKTSETAVVCKESSCNGQSELIKTYTSQPLTSAERELCDQAVSSEDSSREEPMLGIKEEVIDAVDSDGEVDCAIVGVDISKKMFLLQKDIDGTVVDLINESPDTVNTEVKVEYDSDVGEPNVDKESTISNSTGAPVAIPTENEKQKSPVADADDGKNASFFSNTAPNTKNVDIDSVSKSQRENTSSDGTTGISEKESNPQPAFRVHEANFLSKAEGTEKSVPNEMNILMKSLEGILTTMQKSSDTNLPNSTDEVSHDPRTTVNPILDLQKPACQNPPAFNGCEIVISDDDDDDDGSAEDANRKSTTNSEKQGSCHANDIRFESQIKKEPLESQSEEQDFVGGSEEVLDASTLQALKVLLNKTLSRQTVTSHKRETDTEENRVGNTVNEVRLNSDTQTGKNEASINPQDIREHALTSSTSDGENSKQRTVSDGHTSTANSHDKVDEPTKALKKRDPKPKCGPKSYKARWEMAQESPAPSLAHPDSKGSQRQIPRLLEPHPKATSPCTEKKKKPGPKRWSNQKGTESNLQTKKEKKPAPKPFLKRKFTDSKSPSEASKRIKLSSPPSQNDSSQFQTVPLCWSQSKTDSTHKSTTELREVPFTIPIKHSSFERKEHIKAKTKTPLPTTNTVKLVQPKTKTSAKSDKVVDSNIPLPQKNINIVAPNFVNSLRVETKKTNQVVSPASVHGCDMKSPASTVGSCNDNLEDSDSSLSDDDNDHDSLGSSDSSEEEVDMEYRCKLCSKSFQKKSHFKKHMTVHYGGDVGNKPAKRYHCKACRRKFVDKTALQAHLLQRKYCFFDCTRLFWKKKTGSIDLCKMCGKGTANWKDLKKHCFKNLTCRLRYIDKILENSDHHHKSHKEELTSNKVSGNEQTSCHDDTDVSVSEAMASSNEQDPAPSQTNTDESDQSGITALPVTKQASGPYQCRCCQKMIGTPVDFRKHVNIKANAACKEFNLIPNNCPVNLHYCSKCEISLSSESRLLNHPCFGKASVVECPGCFQPFNNGYGLRRHQRMSNCGTFTEESKQPTKNKNARNQIEASLSPHSTHYSAGERRIVCLLCKKVCDNLSDLLEHSHVHTDEGRYECSESECQMVFNRFNGLVSHNIWHKRKLDSMPSTLTVTPSSRIVKPVTESGPEPEDKEFKCNLCKLTFDSKEALQFHRMTHRPWDGARYVCPVCPLKYPTVQLFKAHVDRHKKALERRVLKRLKPLKIKKPVEHFKAEINETFFSCLACGQQFPTLSGRHEHLESSAECRAFKSVLGGNHKPRDSVGGSSKSKLKSCTPAPNFSKCTICSLTLRKASFRNHLKIHLRKFSKSVRENFRLESDNTSYKCRCLICGTMFSSSGGLLRHLKKHRPVDIIKPLVKNSRVKATDSEKNDEVLQESASLKPQSQVIATETNKTVVQKIGKVSYFFSCKICSKKVNSIPAFKFHLKIAHKYKTSEGWSEFVNYLQSDSEARSNEESSVQTPSVKTPSPPTPNRPKPMTKVMCEICKNAVSKNYLPKHMNRVHGLDRTLFFARRIKSKTPSPSLVSPQGKTDGVRVSAPLLTTDGPAGHSLPSDEPSNRHENYSSDASSTISDSESVIKECSVCHAVFPTSGKLWRHQFMHITPCSVPIDRLVLYNPVDYDVSS